MFSPFIFVFMLATVANAHFFKKHHHHHYFMTDMNGFHHGYHGGYGGYGGYGGHMFNKVKQYGPPPPMYGPPGPPPPFPHHPIFPGYQGSGYNHEVGFGSMNVMNPMPFNPWGPNFPFNQPNIFNVPFSNYPNQFGGVNPTKTPQSNTGLDTTTVPTYPGPNSVLVDISAKPSGSFGIELNVHNPPKNGRPINLPNGYSGSTEATIPFGGNPYTSQNNDNNFIQGGTKFVPNNNFDINNQPTVNVPSASEPTTYESTTNKNGLEYDIDVRFDDRDDNAANQKTTSSP